MVPAEIQGAPTSAATAMLWSAMTRHRFAQATRRRQEWWGGRSPTGAWFGEIRRAAPGGAAGTTSRPSGPSGEELAALQSGCGLAALRLWVEGGWSQELRSVINGERRCAASVGPGVCPVADFSLAEVAAPATRLSVAPVLWERTVRPRAAASRFPARFVAIAGRGSVP